MTAASSAEPPRPPSDRPPSVWVVHPSSAAGSVRAPASKSYTHRALVAAALSPDGGRVLEPLRSDDTAATLRAIEALGGQVISATGTTAAGVSVEALDVRPIPRRGGSLPKVPVADVGESGTTLRFFSAVAALSTRPVRFEGKPGLARRPLNDLLGALDHLGAQREGPTPGSSLPFTIHGPIHPGTVDVRGDVSSQFVSALLLTLPTLEGDSEVRVQGPRVSEPYVEATTSLLRAQGLRVEARPEGYRIPGGQVYRGGDLVVPGDASSASYFLALGALTGGPVKVTGIPRASEWPQADLALLDLLEEAGARVRRGALELEVARDAFPLHPFRAQLDPSPDLAPLLAVLASFSEGNSELVGGAHLASKESDRRAGCLLLAKALGARATDEGGTLHIRGPATARSLELTELTDHRLLFSACVAAAALPEPSHLGPPSATWKSYPGFFADLQALGVRCETRPTARAGEEGR